MVDAIPVTADSDQIARAYDALAPLYDHVVARWEAPTYAHALVALDPTPGETVLDVGCGPGHLVERVAAAVAPDGHVYGVDVAPRMLDRAARRLANAPAPVDLVKGDARALPLAESSVDAVTLTETLELFTSSDAATVLSEIRRVLRTDGRLVVTSMERAGFETTAFVRAYEWGYRHVPGYAAVGCRPIDVTRTLIDSGFAVERVETVRRAGIWPTTIAVARP